jgi:predicted DNA-binding transcriptional regulator AlpA
MHSRILQEYTPPVELASELGVCVKTLERWRTLGQGPPVTKIGRRVYYRRSSVAAWLNSREEANE